MPVEVILAVQAAVEVVKNLPLAENQAFRSRRVAQIKLGPCSSSCCLIAGAVVIGNTNAY